MLMYCINEIEVTKLQFRVWLSTVQDILWIVSVCVFIQWNIIQPENRRKSYVWTRMNLEDIMLSEIS